MEIIVELEQSMRFSKARNLNLNSNVFFTDLCYAFDLSQRGLTSMPILLSSVQVGSSSWNS